MDANNKCRRIQRLHFLCFSVAFLVLSCGLVVIFVAGPQDTCDDKSQYDNFILPSTTRNNNPKNVPQIATPLTRAHCQSNLFVYRVVVGSVVSMIVLCICFGWRVCVLRSVAPVEDEIELPTQNHTATPVNRPQVVPQFLPMGQPQQFMTMVPQMGPQGQQFFTVVPQSYELQPMNQQLFTVVPPQYVVTGMPPPYAVV